MHAPLAPERRLLLKAADLLREKGWCQRVLERDGMHCVVGAVFASAPEDGLTPVSVLALDLLGKFIGIDRAYLPSWNNADERTVEEVIEALDGAALRT